MISNKDLKPGTPVEIYVKREGYIKRVGGKEIVIACPSNNSEIGFEVYHVVQSSDVNKKVDLVSKA